MAIWNYRMALVPRESTIQHFSVLPGKVPDIDDLWPHLWKGYQLDDKLKETLLQFGPELCSWSEEIRVWGDLDGSTIEIILSPSGSIEEITFKFDLRDECQEAIIRLCNFAINYDLLLLTSEADVIKSEPSLLAQKIRSSTAFLSLDDPERAFRAAATAIEAREAKEKSELHRPTIAPELPKKK
jgi:hypothetical protein